MHRRAGSVSHPLPPPPLCGAGGGRGGDSGPGLAWGSLGGEGGYSGKSIPRAGITPNSGKENPLVGVALEFGKSFR
jgi:hypothetical protein